MKEVYRNLYFYCKEHDKLAVREKREINGLTFWKLTFFSKNTKIPFTTFYIVNDLIVSVVEGFESVIIFDDVYEVNNE